MSEDDLDKLGLLKLDDGKVICTECSEVLRFNSGNPAVFHKDNCSKSVSGPTYLGSGQLKMNIKGYGK